MYKKLVKSYSEMKRRGAYKFITTYQNYGKNHGIFIVNSIKKNVTLQVLCNDSNKILYSLKIKTR